ncbi:SDR family NAD(P)-dependent oxidoreductase [Dongia soli]|uniref:SDR family oxidoreductase n=1 Tax=Dongia soli TaxID=600628 RepID=A0ABU5EHH0_9PROT|nr:SDR family oxidoreductase [Dongia soli]MDY0884826.1 SDR family oxidoreductase [Dongia soli]
MTAIEKKVAIVTGASQGIGAGLVEGLLEHGYKVVANSRSIRPSNRTDVINVAGDIANRQVAESVIETALRQFGRIDTLVNNAGIFVSKPFTDYTDADFRNVMSVNVEGFFHISQLAAAQMLKQGSGHIVNITTTLVDQPLAGVPAVMAALTKGGLDAVTRSLAIEYADKGIRVNAVSPGIIKTPMHAPATHAALAKLHPLGRMGEIKDIVDAVLYLDQADFVTGEVLRVDGGQHAGRW